MYLFIPEHFLAKNVDANSVRIYSQTYLCRGVRFFSTQGRWVLSQVSVDYYIYFDIKKSLISIQSDFRSDEWHQLSLEFENAFSEKAE